MTTRQRRPHATAAVDIDEAIDAYERRISTALADAMQRYVERGGHVIHDEHGDAMRATLAHIIDTDTKLRRALGMPNTRRTRRQGGAQ